MKDKKIIKINSWKDFISEYKKLINESKEGEKKNIKIFIN